MNFDNNIVDIANCLREIIQHDPSLPTVDHGESVAILMWWSFLLDHSRAEGIPIATVAREQLESFIPVAIKHFNICRPGEH